MYQLMLPVPSPALQYPGHAPNIFVVPPFYLVGIPLPGLFALFYVCGWSNLGLLFISLRCPNNAFIIIFIWTYGFATSQLK